MIKHSPTLSKRVPEKGRLLLANGLLISPLNYLMPVWGGIEQKYVKKLQVLLSQIARYVTGYSKYTRTRVLMERCGWLHIQEQIEYFSLVQLWKVTRLCAPKELSRKFTWLPDRSSQTTNCGNRFQDKICSPLEHQISSGRPPE